jgi:hypothetical protein
MLVQEIRECLNARVTLGDYGLGIVYLNKRPAQEVGERLPLLAFQFADGLLDCTVELLVVLAHRFAR